MRLAARHIMGPAMDLVLLVGNGLGIWRWLGVGLVLRISGEEDGHWFCVICRPAAPSSLAVEPCLCKARIPEEYVDRNLQSIFT